MIEGREEGKSSESENSGGKNSNNTIKCTKEKESTMTGIYFLLFPYFAQICRYLSSMSLGRNQRTAALLSMSLFWKYQICSPRMVQNLLYVYLLDNSIVCWNGYVTARKSIVSFANILIPLHLVQNHR